MGDEKQAEPTDAKDGWSFSADRPIPGRKEDKFQRAGFADALAAQVLGLPKNDSFVLGLVGPWGTGKTSILSMLEESIATRDDVVVLKFNPWLFSGTEQLAAHFFQELAAQLIESSDKELQTAGEMLVGYSEALSPLTGIPFIGKLAERLSGVAKAAGESLKRKGGALPASVSAQRRAISKLLQEHGKRLLVIVDDIDRLPKADIRELFKLVRLTADFPNTTYVLAFDRSRVEDALGETEGEGRAYLEKILQVTFDVPLIRPPDLAGFLLKEIQRAVDDRPQGPFDEAEWINIFALVIRPLFRTPRDVRRYTNGIPAALSVIGEEIAVADLLAIEAIRSLLPDVWSKIHACVDMLTNTMERTFSSARRVDEEKVKFESWLAAAGEHRAAVQEFCARIFPPSRRFIDNHHYGHESAKRWRKERRLASADILRFYFEKSLPSDVLRSTSVQEIFDALGDENQLRAALSKLDEAQIEHVCSRLEDYEDDFPAQVAEPALVAFFEQYPRLREGRRGFYDLGAGLAITRLGLRLLKRVDDEAERDAIVKRVATRIETLSARKELLDLVGWHNNAGSKLVSRTAAADLEAEFQTATVSTSPQALAAERDLVWLLRWADNGDDTVPELAKAAAKDDQFLVRLLRSGVSERTSRGLRDVAGRQQQTLPWDYLVELLGADVLATRVDELNARRASLSLDERDATAVDTALRYRGGWRPGRFMEDERVEEHGGPSAEERAESRTYGAPILIDLLESIVPARRKVARDRVAHMADNNITVPDEVVGRLAETAADEEAPPVERALVIDLLRRLDEEERIRSPLTAQWFVSKSITTEISQRISALYLDHPGRLPQLLQILEKVEVVNAELDRVRDGVVSVAYLLEHHAAELQDEISARALAAVERFDGVEALQPVVARARKMHAGERA